MLDSNLCHVVGTMWVGDAIILPTRGQMILQKWDNITHTPTNPTCITTLNSLCPTYYYNPNTQTVITEDSNSARSHYLACTSLLRATGPHVILIDNTFHTRPSSSTSIWLPVRAHAWAARQAPSRGCVKCMVLTDRNQQAHRTGSQPSAHEDATWQGGAALPGRVLSNDAGTTSTAHLTRM